jgi:hypothetical protein
MDGFQTNSYQIGKYVYVIGLVGKNLSIILIELTDFGDRNIASFLINQEKVMKIGMRYINHKWRINYSKMAKFAMMEFWWQIWFRNNMPYSKQTYNHQLFKAIEHF